MKKKWLEERYQTFTDYENDLDAIELHELSPEEMIENKELIEEARLGCLAGMLLCLNREQRIIYILGEIFLVPQDIGAEGWVDTKTMKFNTSYLQRIYEIAPMKDDTLKKLEMFEYQHLQRTHPFQEKNIAIKCFHRLLKHKIVEDLFEL
ncbi:hypothetical protein [Lacrimispora sphenoides]|jgi:hypothetical protein|uniref:hypothetical protein n=1 Tax=Lacrimispora sphenoides TaxID=29370 RepID=UPI000B862EB1|nr:hypothetical protein [Lacrimispora sphenoides]